jgi:hypothetical protein
MHDYGLYHQHTCKPFDKENIEKTVEILRKEARLLRQDKVDSNLD